MGRYYCDDQKPDMEALKDICAFGIVMKECYFCGQPRTIRTNEHYVFCPNCMALYTKLIIQESNCEHIKDGVPCVKHGPMAINHRWTDSGLQRFKPGFDKPFIWEDYEEGDDGTVQKCSKCHADCVADGW